MHSTILDSFEWIAEGEAIFLLKFIFVLFPEKNLSRYQPTTFLFCLNRMATFSDARKQITDGIESSLLPKTWRFFIPKLGPVRRLQERQLMLLDVLGSTTDSSRLGRGCAQNPLSVIIQDCTNSP